MVNKEASYFHLAAGPVTIGIKFEEPAKTAAVAEYFKGYSSTSELDLMIDFSLMNHVDFPEIPESLIQAKRWNGNELAEDLFHGHFDSAEGAWNVIAKYIMTKGQISRVFEQFLYQAFYSACTRRDVRAFLLHSSGITIGNRGFLFVGASGMGKSTVVELSRAYGVVNDEINIITPLAEGLRMHASPFNVYCTGKQGTASNVRAVFLLRHAQSCSIQPVSPAFAVAELTGQVVPPLGLEDEYTPAVASEMMNIALAIVRTVPVYYLNFPVEGGFWPLILQAFP